MTDGRRAPATASSLEKPELLSVQVRPRGEGGETAVCGASEGEKKGQLHQFSSKKENPPRPPRVLRKEEAAAVSDGRKIHSIL